MTSVELHDPETLVCASFLEKKMYLVRFDGAAGHRRILDEIATIHRGIPVETDLADVDPSGEQIALSNFHHGSLGLYRRSGDRLAFVADLDLDLASGRFEIGPLRTFEDTHFDACVLHAGRLYPTDQRNDCFRILDPDSFDALGEIGGYDFPHGIDAGFGQLAVWNYGSNSIDLRPIDGIRSRPARSILGSDPVSTGR